jgi:integrase
MQKIPRFKRPDDNLRKETSIWTEAELKSFLDAVPDNKWQYRILYHFLFYTGLRKNEALSLTWNDYDGKKVKVYRQFQNGKWKPLKTKNSIRNIVLDPITIEKINELHNWAESQTNYNPNWFIFGDFKQMGTSEIGRVKDKAIKKAGVPYIRIHDLRHSHASYLINKGVNMVIVSRRLGHSSIQMTIDRYTHLLPDAQDEVIKAIME